MCKHLNINTAESLSCLRLPLLLSLLKLLEQVKDLELAISEQSGERDELIGKLDKITEDHTSANQNTETMVSKIQVREHFRNPPVHQTLVEIQLILFLSGFRR